MQQSKEKVRLYALARELHMESKDLLDLCRQSGIDIKNQLSSLEPEQRDQILGLVKRGPGGPATSATATRPAAPPTLPPAKVPVLAARRGAEPPAPARREAEPEPMPAKPATPAASATPAAPPTVAPAASITPTPTPAEKPSAPVTTPMPAAPAAMTPEAPVAAPSHPPEAPAAKTPEAPAVQRPPQPPSSPGQPAGATPRPNIPAHGGAPGVRNLNTPRPGPSAPRRDRPLPRPPQTGNFRIAPPPPLKPQRAAEPPKPAAPTGPRKISEIPKELQNSDKPITIENILNKTPAKPPSPGSIVVPIDDLEDDDGDKKKGAGAKQRPGLVPGRDARHKERNARQAKRKETGDAPLKGDRLTALLAGEESTRGTRLKPRRPKHKAGPQPRKGKVPITLPISVRSLSEAIGVKSTELLFKLMGHGLPQSITINTTLEPDLAETVALENGCELDVKRGADVEGDLLADVRKVDRPEDLTPRAPIVTIMGHVDHGKTSLLDKIRHSNVTATEAGGITQVIRAWRVEHNGHPITFLDTPGHEAFTKMRARGANVTDIAVIVVAVDDGVMPQTEEAINHAKAAGVSMVVALNKVDLPNANLRKAEQQLYGLGVLPDNMGGDTPFVQTSAATGKGIDDLLEALTLVAEVKDPPLMANPNKPASGTCLEAYLSEEEGVYATFLVRDGTLRRGDVVLCGATYGRLRAMYDDLGRPIQEAGPTVPVRITGLDEVPNADDPFQVVPDLASAREVADNRKHRMQEAAQFKRTPLALENLSQAKIVELKVILKAEARGSIEAIRKELEKLYHDEVRVRILHAAIGGITESDVQLALTSPQDTLILGFNVVPDDRARALAEERNISIQEYDIIYKLTEDVRAALEGKLKPREDVIHLGRAVVRETFKISRVGTIAGCYVTQGTIERSAKVRVIRSGAVIYPPPERTVGLDSLKRFKEDVKEVREGFECGIKVVGYDDIKVDDVIEAYRIEQVQRTLS